MTKLWLVLAVTLGTLVLGGQQVQAAGKVEPIHQEWNVYSQGLETPIYSDPECTQSTGKVLSTNVDTWKAFNWYYASEPYIIPAAYDLGGGQWVKATAVQPITGNVNTYAEFFTDHQAVAVYSDPEFKNQVATLAPTIADWQVTRYTTYSDGISALDLGHNQWVRLTEGRLIPTAVNALAGTQLCDLAGQPTATIMKTDDYKVLGVRNLNGTTYVKLGSDQQWLKF